MSTVADALRDCQMAVKGRIARVPTDEVVLQTFVEKFRRPPTRYCPPSAARKESRCDGSTAQPRNPDPGDLP